MQATSMEEPNHLWIRQVFGAILRIIWTAVRLPLLAFLIVLEPFVCALLWLIATAGILGAFFYELLVKDPRYPFWQTIGLSIGAALLAGLYIAVIRLLGGGKA